MLSVIYLHGVILQVASWGAYLLSRDILTVSFAPRDTPEAQVQFALERGALALIGVLASKGKFEKEISVEHPNAFWDRKKYLVSIPYEEGFDEKKIPTNARPIHMNKELTEYGKKGNTITFRWAYK
ncbi:hypothetical protein L6164_026228 [Bauhinia variegata]|uniref:Uncharacterized protein n=1 Tax=Bauhinia variegata TaxID=167791 RepID=A0ACB9LR08_BAUVA|nr:hypothetical protein L6164_026228 [Bauhinia variegata]